MDTDTPDITVHVRPYTVYRTRPSDAVGRAAVPSHARAQPRRAPLGGLAKLSLAAPRPQERLNSVSLRRRHHHDVSCALRRWPSGRYTPMKRQPAIRGRGLLPLPPDSRLHQLPGSGSVAGLIVHLPGSPVGCTALHPSPTSHPHSISLALLLRPIPVDVSEGKHLRDSVEQWGFPRVLIRAHDRRTHGWSSLPPRPRLASIGRLTRSHSKILSASR